MAAWFNRLVAYIRQAWGLISPKVYGIMILWHGIIPCDKIPATDPITVQKLMAHSDLNTTAGYDRRGEEEKKSELFKHWTCPIGAECCWGCEDPPPCRPGERLRAVQSCFSWPASHLCLHLGSAGTGGALGDAVTLGMQSEAGSRFVERVLTTVMTLRQQKRDVLDYITQACAAHIRGDKAPSPLAGDLAINAAT